MKKGIKAMCIGLCAALFISAAPKGTFAEGPDSSVIKGSFTTDGVKENYFYSDEYFSHASNVEDMHLNTMSLVLALTIGDKDIGRIFEETGFTGTEYGEMDIAPTKDTVGTAIARRKINGQDVVAVVIRGTQYKNEWASNFIGGASGNAKGFETASFTVNERLKKYISDNGLSDVKIWVTGYSRAGAIASLTGAYINEHPEEFSTKTKDVYVYTFEAPMASTSEKKYDNIWCTRNKNDIVNYIYPEGWGFSSNGKDMWIGGYKIIPAKKFDLGADGFFTDVKYVEMDEFLDELTDFMADGLPRENYSGDCEKAVSTVVDIWNSKTSEEKAKLKAYLKNDVKNTITDDTAVMSMLFNDVNNGLLKHENDKMYQKVTNDIISVLDKAAEGGNMPLSDEEYALLKEQLYPILRQFGPVIVRDYIYREGKDYTNAFPESHFDPDYDPATDPKFAVKNMDESSILAYELNAEQAPLWRLYHVSTVLKNVGAIMDEHYGHNVFALVKTYDSYYPEYAKREDSSSMPEYNSSSKYEYNSSSKYEDNSSSKSEDNSSSQPDKKNVLGDVNGDNKIDIEDAVMVINHVNGQKALTDEQSKRANIDGNEKVDIEDAVAIIAHVNGIKVIK